MMKRNEQGYPLLPNGEVDREQTSIEKEAFRALRSAGHVTTKVN